MAIVGVVGLSASGKTTIIKRYTARGFESLDDVGRNGDWPANTRRVRALADSGRDVVVSDILFCCRTASDVAKIGIPTSFRGREEFERAVGLPVEWVFFQNNAWRAAKNCLSRRMYRDASRKLDFEIPLMLALTTVYAPPGDALPVVVSDPT